ncbi:MAG TPA: isoprenylcysteine carboxylmethyltransferase family protein [Vicinamibacterales bacterium]|jgi:methyltransferase
MVATLFAIVFGTMIGESIRASRNERAQFQLGGVEPPDDVYQVMRIMYPGVFLAMFAERLMSSSSPPVPVAVAGGVVFAAAKALKWWAIRSLGRSWTFRVIVVPGMRLVVRGPYRWLRHPNYVGVVGELVGVALLLGATITGPLGLVAFSGLLIKRIAVENRTLTQAAR